jgi:thiosulfate reductase cytochrome b subunit
MTALYLYPGWVRAWHWINALLFLALILSGASMHFSGAGWLLDFETARPVHNVSGILLTLFWVWFLAGNLTTDNGRHYRIRLRGLPTRILEQSRYYAVGIFRNAPHPFHPSESEKLNELQKLTYLGVMYGLMPILILSGWAFLLMAFLPKTIFGIGSVWAVAMTHLTVAYLLVLFLLTHLYVITTGDTVLQNLRAMITGWHGDRS